MVFNKLSLFTKIFIHKDSNSFFLFVLSAVLQNVSYKNVVTQQIIEQTVKLWLRAAGDREGGREKRRPQNKEKSQEN